MLMNSFSTSDDTKAFLGKSHGDLMSESNVELLQNKSPKVDAKTMAPIEWSQDPDQQWWGPLVCLVPQIVTTSSQSVRRQSFSLAQCPMPALKR